MKRSLILITGFLLLMVGVCHAQQIRSYGSGKLSCSLIKNIVQDAYGFVWIGTENGLNKFDGWTFTNYFHDDRDSTSLLNNLVESLLCDSQGNLWVGSGNGLQLYSPYEDSFRSVRFLDGNRPSVLHLQELHTGEIWAVTAGYGAYSIDKETMEATSLVRVNDLCSSPFMHNIYQDSRHRIWIALPNGKIARIASDLKDVDFLSSSADALGRICTILEDLKGRVWVAAGSGIYLWNEEESHLIKMEQPVNEFIGVRGMICTKRGELYVNTVNGGLYSVDEESKALKPFSSKLELEKDRIYALMEDKDEKLWLGGFKKGIVTLSNESSQFKFKPLSSFTLSMGNTLSFVYEDKKNRIWTSTTDGRLIRMDSDMQNHHSYVLGEGVVSMLHDSEETIWLGSYSGLSQFNEQTGAVHKIPLLQGKAIHNIVEGRNQLLYMSVLGEGFVEYNRQTGVLQHICDTTKLSTTMRLANNWINKIVCDSEGLIWLGHCMGINCYDPVRREFLKLDCERFLLSSLCFAFLEDKKGHIWIGTNNGLFEYDKKTLKLSHYGMEEGIPSNMICGLGQSRNGDIWCSTFNGLCKLSYPERKIATYSSNGSVEKEYLRGVYYQREYGDIYWGGLHGITKLMSDSIGRQSPLCAPQLVHVYLNDKEVSADTQLGGRTISDKVWMDARQINLTYKNDIFSFEFSTMEYHDRENIRFEYRLAELDGVWRSTSSGENRITYNYLPSGHYTFEVCVCENERKSPVRSFSIYIAPPWYDTLWAKMGYLLLCAGLLFWIFYAWYMRQRRRRQEEMNEEKLKFFINIAHELRSPITLIVSPLAALVKTEQEESRKKALLTMQRNANRILNLINQLLDIRKIDKGQMKIECRETDLVGFIEELFQMFDYQATKRNIRFDFVHTMEKLPVWIDRNNFDKVLMNLIVNAFKYTPDGGEIILSLTVGGDRNMHGPLSGYAEITVTDSGMGLDEKKLERIFERFYQASTNSHGFGIGLNLTKMLVELHHGSIFASNRVDKQGSSFTVSIPLGKEHLNSEELAEEAISSNEEPTRLILSEETCWEEEEESKSPASKSKTQWRILVVDDDEEIREYLKFELGIYYKVITACNGAEAYQIALSQRVDLIISDVVMPEMDGFELLKRTRGNANISHIPFVLLTSQTEYDSRLKGWNVGADAFLAKPFQIEELLLICENLITGRIRLKGRFGMDQEVEEKMKTIEVKANDEYFMERLMKAINENLEDSKFSVEDLAEAVGVSRVQLHRKLKTLTGNTTTEFIRNIRLKQAAKLLKERKVNISQIAYLVGFTNPTLFSIAFKKFYGCAPSEYADRKTEE